MASPNPGAARQYFLGVAGQQIGPFSEEEVILRIKAGSVSIETLVWYEGLKDWGLISTIAVFDATFKTKRQPEEKAKAEPRKVAEAVSEKKSSPKPQPLEQFLGDDKGVSVVFNASESRLGDSSFVSDRTIKILGGLLSLVLIVIGFFYITATFNRDQVEKRITKKKVHSSDSRQIKLGKATSELLIDTKTSEATLLDLIRANSIDAVAQAASKALLEFYSGSQRYGDAGRVLLLSKKYEEAAKFFSMDSGTRSEAEKAYYLAYENAKVPAEKKLYLEESIKGLLANGLQQENAIKRIRLLEKDFPNQTHPFSYYLKSIDDRIFDIFPRISFNFVQGLLGYVNSEFPQITLIDRPLVEIKKGKDGLYKIVGTYKGEILLNKDRLKQIQIIFWLAGERWVLVDTNLTPERKRWAEQERRKLKNIGISGDQLLKTLESAFKNKFPDASFHEKNLNVLKKIEEANVDF